MTDLRRTLLWVVFSMSLVLLWDAWNKHNGQPSMFAPPVAQPAASAAAKPVDVPTVSGAVASVPAADAAASAPAGQLVEVTTDLVKATLDSRGGTLVRLELLQHKELPPQKWYEPLLALVTGRKDEREASNVVLFDRSAHRIYMAETGLLNVPNPVTHLSPMRVQPGDFTLKPGQNDLSVSFESTDAAVKLVKTYVFHRGKYTVDVRHEVANLGAAPIPAPQVYLQLKRDGDTLGGGSSFYSTFTGPAVHTETTRFAKLDFKDIDKGKATVEKKADNGWVAMVQHYFTSAWLHNAKQDREFNITTSDAAQNGLGRRLYSVSMVFTLPAVAPGAKQGFDSVLFAGPQEETQLEALAPGLELVKDYGIFAILAKPLFWLLSQLHKLIGNWGWSIVALVVLLKIAFFWLNASAYRSMAKMKAVNPRIMELRERLKDKPQQLQQEMLRIYREEKVNPLGGCLPIVVQMPFFIALYWVLLSTVEMRAAPWAGWVTDLSLPDPYFILPLLMTLTSLLQTWLNPRPPDPVQAKMMWFMPLIFSVMFFFFPAGLVLYWLTNNILSIAQQWLINKQMGVLNNA